MTGDFGDVVSLRGPTQQRRASTRAGRARAGRPQPTEGPLSQALTSLESGLLEDLRLVSAAESRGLVPAWSQAAVVGDLPSRFRPAYDARFVHKLVREGFALNRDRVRGRCAPDCAGQFVLARWALDRAELIAQCQTSPVVGTRRDWARELGLVRPQAFAFAPAGSDPWASNWSLDAIRVRPELWFEPAIGGPAPGRPVDS